MKKKIIPLAIILSLALVAIIYVATKGDAHEIDATGLTMSEQTELATRILEEEGSIGVIEGMSADAYDDIPEHAYTPHGLDMSLSDNPKPFGSGIEEYRTKIDSKGTPTFVDAQAAYDRFIVEYAEDIERVRSELALGEFGPETFELYSQYAWQLDAPQEIAERAAQITFFLGIYENSLEAMKESK